MFAASKCPGQDPYPLIPGPFLRRETPTHECPSWSCQLCAQVCFLLRFLVSHGFFEFPCQNVSQVLATKVAQLRFHGFVFVLAHIKV